MEQYMKGGWEKHGWVMGVMRKLGLAWEDIVIVRSTVRRQTYDSETNEKLAYESLHLPFLVVLAARVILAELGVLLELVVLLVLVIKVTRLALGALVLLVIY
jgi:hypothetical protein